MSEAFSSLDKFLLALLDGEYDKEEQKAKVCCVVMGAIVYSPTHLSFSIVSLPARDLSCPPLFSSVPSHSPPP